MNFGIAMLVSLVLLALNAFFVAAEFALIASKRHRLEQHLANRGGRAARAALRGNRELSLMLAGAQLGITLCTLGLGAVLKPAVADALDALFSDAGVPDGVSYAIAFLIALTIEVFLHLVIGEMMPKSWAISHPERSALLLALPFRACAWLARPVLSVLNALANGTLRLFKVTPQDTLAQAHGPEELRYLLQESRAEGLLPAGSHSLLDGVLQVQRTTVADVTVPRAKMVTVAAGADAAEVERTCLGCGRSRLVVVAENGDIIGVVHIREAARANTLGEHATARQLMAQPFTVPAALTVSAAVSRMRTHRAQLALVTEQENPRSTVTGLVAMEDLLEEVIGPFDDETDTRRRSAPRT